MKVKKGMQALSLLLVAVFAVAMFVPVVSAEEKTATADMTGNSIYEILGLKEPVVSEGSQWQSYDQKSEEAEKLITLSGLNIQKDQILGYIEGESERAFLYKTDGDNYNIILEADGIISVEMVEVVDLGSKMISYPGKNDQSETIIEYSLKEINLSNTASKEFSSKSVYSATITRTDSWIYLGITSATLYTKGTFTYDYGNEILGISDSSYTYQGLNFARCDFDHSTRVTGITGYVEADVIWAYSAVSPPKHSVDAWISCNYYGSTDGDSNYSDWVAVGVACAALP